MSIPETVVLDVPNLLTVAGVAVAILSALISGRSASSARRQAEAAELAVKEAKAQSALTRSAVIEARAQNRISMHGHRLEAYKALLSFSSQLTTNGIHFKREVTWALWEHAQVAEFYFSQSVAQSLKSVIDASLELQSSREEWSGRSDLKPGERAPLVEASYAQYERLKLAIKFTDEQMRKELRLVETEG